MTSPDQPTIVTAGENDRNKILTKYLHLSMAGNHHAFALLYDDTSPLVYGNIAFLYRLQLE